ncbi:hypothetical protein GN244_ATG09747 [Phytophthora infestans]|uniref:Uncharacterized protein n=1 Tax=Phytophthora infestans TaxID=4787 RepID=A0A833SQU8_PHYIN|nr:hypothetical protein GN244_ATG09747 [Phytophthora infestans]
MALMQDWEYRSRKKTNTSARQVEQYHRSKSAVLNIQDENQAFRPGNFQRSSASSARDSKSGETKGPREGYLKCGVAHYVSKCPDASEEEKKDLLRSRRGLPCGGRQEHSHQW